MMAQQKTFLIVGILMIFLFLFVGCKSSGGGDVGAAAIEANILAPDPANPVDGPKDPARPVESTPNPPQGFNDLVIHVEIVRGMGFLKSKQEYNIRFFEYQNMFEIYDHESYLISSGSYSYDAILNIAIITVNDSRFGEGTMLFNFDDSISGKFSLEVSPAPGYSITDWQRGLFRIEQDEPEVEEVDIVEQELNNEHDESEELEHNNAND